MMISTVSPLCQPPAHLIRLCSVLTYQDPSQEQFEQYLICFDHSSLWKTV